MLQRHDPRTCHTIACTADDVATITSPSSSSSNGASAVSDSPQSITRHRDPVRRPGRVATAEAPFSERSGMSWSAGPARAHDLKAQHGKRNLVLRVLDVWTFGNDRCFMFECRVGDRVFFGLRRASAGNGKSLIDGSLRPSIGRPRERDEYVDRRSRASSESVPGTQLVQRGRRPAFRQLPLRQERIPRSAARSRVRRRSTKSDKQTGG